MKISNKGVQLLKEFEGLRLEAYQDAGGVWTIGYGNTFYENNEAVKKGDTITQERATDLYRGILTRFEELVENKGMVLNQNQFDAFVSFTYNLGGNPLIELSNEHIAGTMTREKWVAYCNVRVNGKLKPLQGLINRRNKEYDLYSTIDVNTPQTPVLAQPQPIKEIPVSYKVEEVKTPSNYDDRTTGFFEIMTKNHKFIMNVSSTKVFMLILAGVIGAAFMKGVLKEENFMYIALSVIAFYTGNKVSK